MFLHGQHNHQPPLFMLSLLLHYTTTTLEYQERATASLTLVREAVIVGEDSLGWTILDLIRLDWIDADWTGLD